jgi:hypothetical protein
VKANPTPPEMTVEGWRRLRAERRRSAPRHPTRARAAARRVVPLRPEPCDHLHDTTTRYDHAHKQLSFLLVCHVCGTEKLIDAIPYEPSFNPNPTTESAGGTVHRPAVRRHQRPLPRAA